MADVKVADGVIVDVGKVVTAGARALDADGAVVCPGFIDLHSHADYTVREAPDAVTQATQGVTTLVTGNCGFSPFPVVPEREDELVSLRLAGTGAEWDWTTAGEFVDVVDRLDLGINIALQVGHGAIRTAAMGLDDRAPTEVELEQMRSFVAQAAADGVVGFSTGLLYAPGQFAKDDELVAVVTEAASAGLLYSTHMRDEHAGLVDSVLSSIDVAKKTAARLEISHLKAAGPENWGTVSAAIDAIAAARADGVDVAADQYPYTASSTRLSASMPAWAMDGGAPALLRGLEDADFVARLAGELNDRSGRTFWPERIVIADTSDGPHAKYTGWDVARIAEDLGTDVGRAVAELLRAQKGHVGVVHHSMSDDDVEQIMAKDFVSVASDGWVLHCPGDTQPHPRSFGTFTRVLARYVREKNVVELADAIRKMTAQPASRLGWTGNGDVRGVVRPGAIADLAVFDPDTVADHATFDNPWQLSTGVLHTLVAGTPVLENGEPTGTAAGRVLRK